MIFFKTKVIENRISLFLEGTDYNSYHVYYFYSPLFFINIPKNASSSVNEMLKIVSINLNVKPFWFTVIRDPYERLISTFRFLSKIYNFELLSNSLKKFPMDQSNEFFGQFCHFAPQSIFVNFFEKQHLDINYYNINNLKNLSEDVFKLTGVNYEITHINQSNKNSQLDNKILSWIEKNKQFVDEFLETDIIWYNNLIKGKKYV